MREFVTTLIRTGAIRELMEIAQKCPPGCLVEVGVWRGGSANALDVVAEHQNRRLYLYDTFEGMPYYDPGDSHPVGAFADTTIEEVQEVAPNAKIIKGVFPASADPEMKDVAFAHIDVDQYRAVKESALFLVPLMVPGGRMVFDDYYMVPAATRAIEEMFGSRIQLTHNWKGMVVF